MNKISLNPDDTIDDFVGDLKLNFRKIDDHPLYNDASFIIYESKRIITAKNNNDEPIVELTVEPYFEEKAFYLLGIRKEFLSRKIFLCLSKDNKKRLLIKNKKVGFTNIFINQNPSLIELCIFLFLPRDTFDRIYNYNIVPNSIIDIKNLFTTENGFFLSKHDSDEYYKIYIKDAVEIDETSKKRLEKLLHNEPSSDFGIELIESYTIKPEE